MVILFIFALSLLISGLISELAGRTVLSISVFFLVVGIVCSSAGVFQIPLNDPVISYMAEAALVSVLYTDAAKIGIRELVGAWHLPGRALLFGMPLTVFATAAAAHFLAELDWGTSFLIGAILSPTDPVFAASLVNSESVSRRLRRLLNVESGVNDGLALPAVLFLMSRLVPGERPGWSVLLQLVAGVALGIVVPWLTIRLERSRYFKTSYSYVPVLGFAVLLVDYSLAKLLQVNVFLAAFASGVTVASMESRMEERFFRLSEALGEVLKLNALLLFGGLVSVRLWTEFSLREYLFAVVAIAFVRPLAIEIALIGSELTWRERLIAGWFGPKGFASVVFGLLVLNSSIPRREHLFHLIALVVTGSIVLFSTTDILAVRWLKRSAPSEEGQAA